MFHKGVLKTYDQDSQTGTIALLESEIELHFSIKDLSSTTVEPQVGERVKCMMEDKEGVKRAKFIVRLDFKNAREDKPLNETYYQRIDDTVDQNKSVERTSAQSELVAEQDIQQQGIKDQLDATHQEPAQPQLSSVLPENEPLSSDEEISVLPVQISAPVESASSLELITPERESETETTQSDTLDISPVAQHVSELNIPNQAEAISITSQQPITELELVLNQQAEMPHLIVEQQQTDHEQPKLDKQPTKFSPSSAPQFEAVDIPEPVHKSSLESVPILHPVSQLEENRSQPISISFPQESESAQPIELKTDIFQIGQSASDTAKIPDLKSAMSFDDIAAALDFNQTKPLDLEKAEPSLIQMGGYEKISSLIESNYSSDYTQQQQAQNHGVELNQDAIDQDTVQSRILSKAKSNQHEAPVSAMEKLKNKLAYKHYAPQNKRKQKKQSSINPWLIASVVLGLVLINLAVFGYQKYTQYQSDQHAKAKLYLLEQERIIEEQRKKMSHVPDKKVLSDKALDDLLGKDRQK